MVVILWMVLGFAILLTVAKVVVELVLNKLTGKKRSLIDILLD